MPYCAARLIQHHHNGAGGAGNHARLAAEQCRDGPMINAVCKPTIGERPATSEKPTASGIIETATTKPAMTSF